jgi:hypothetical protein
MENLVRYRANHQTIERRFAMPVEKVCVICGVVFYVPKCREKTAKACSDTCAIQVRAKSRERKESVTCKRCGKTFLSPRSQAPFRVFCSQECKQEVRKEMLSERFSGSGNPMWKGGEPYHSCGYIQVLDRSHPYAVNGYVFKHRLVVERHMRIKSPEHQLLEKIGDSLYLRKEAVVHHLDGDKKNNRISNLLVCTKGAHTTIHNGAMPKPDQFWPKDAKIVLGKNHNSKVKHHG